MAATVPAAHSPRTTTVVSPTSPDLFPTLAQDIAAAASPARRASGTPTSPRLPLVSQSPRHNQVETATLATTTSPDMFPAAAAAGSPRLSQSRAGAASASAAVDGGNDGSDVRASSSLFQELLAPTPADSRSGTPGGTRLGAVTPGAAIAAATAADARPASRRADSVDLFALGDDGDDV